jgi:hypothetical protein
VFVAAHEVLAPSHGLAGQGQRGEPFEDAFSLMPENAQNSKVLLFSLLAFEPLVQPAKASAAAMTTDAAIRNFTGTPPMRSWRGRSVAQPCAASV